MGGVDFKIPIHLIGFLIKSLVSILTFVFWPEESGLYDPLKFFVLFLKEGGFQNLGISFGMAADYLLNYESPDIDVPLKPF